MNPLKKRGEVLRCFITQYPTTPCDSQTIGEHMNWQERYPIVKTQEERKLLIMEIVDRYLYGDRL